MKQLLAGVSLLALMSCPGGHPAYAQNLPVGVSRPAIAPTDVVYPGCPVPPTTFGNVWYIDPVNGKTQAAGGLGTQASPWNSLQALVGAKINGSLMPVPGYNGLLLSTVWNSGGPVHPGDEVILMSGNYGSFSAGGLSVAGAEIINPVALTIVAGPGQTPVLSSINLAGVTGMVFNGLTVQSQNTDGAYLVSVQDVGLPGVTNSNIVFEHMTIGSAPVATELTWTQAQMGSLERDGPAFLGSVGGAGMTCVSMTNSHITTYKSGVGLFADQLLFQNNELDHFSDDGIDYGSSNLAIVRNSIHDAQFSGDGVHTDGIQGQEPSGPNPPATPGVQPEQNIYIAFNRVFQQTVANLPFTQYLQGIDAFDGDWTNVIVEGNEVAVASCHGIDEESIHNAAIMNNSVLDMGIAADESGCNAQVIVTTSHEGATSSNVRVFNNIAPGFNIIGDPSTGIAIDHNVGYGSGYTTFRYLTSLSPLVAAQEGVTASQVTPAQSGVLNVNDGLGAANEFVSIVPPYNLALKPAAPGFLAGTSIGVPALDMFGNPYVVAPVSIGASAAIR